MPSRSTQTSITAVGGQFIKFSEKWRTFSPLERLLLVRKSQCYYELAVKDFYHRSQLMTDVRTLLDIKYPMSKKMKAFSLELLWKCQVNHKKYLRFIAKSETSEIKAKLVFQFEYSSPIERVLLVHQFRCYYELALRDAYRRNHLISDIKTLLAIEYPMSYNIKVFCQNLLWDYQGYNNKQPLFIAVRGDTAEMKAKMLSQLKSLLPDNTLRIVRQFHNYRAFAKINPFLRSTIMRNAMNTSLIDGTDLRDFSMEILQEFKVYDMCLEPKVLKKQLSELDTGDLVSDIISNEYHLLAISRCHFTTFRVMRYLSESFPSQIEFARLMSRHLREDKCDKYMEKLFYTKQYIL